jgi:predicted 3-demethylubiquinone-9 3-methyltransferase (glyoxalase superfamily)
LQTITPVLWFDTTAEEAMNFYVGVFDDSRILHIERYPDESLDEHFRGMSGKVITGSFVLSGREFQCLDGGPQFTINPSVSFFCAFSDPANITAVWEKLAAGGKVLMPFQAYPWATRYGWVQDKYGVSWQLSMSERYQAAQAVTPLLTFTQDQAGKAREAMDFYTSLFDNSGIDMTAEYEAGEGDTVGFLKHARFHLGDDHFMAMDSSAPHAFAFNEAISLHVACKDQAEIDGLWQALTAEGGEESQCGWCKDRFGVSWQIIPANMGELLSASPAAIQAMMQMRKISIAELEAASSQ